MSTPIIAKTTPWSTVYCTTRCVADRHGGGVGDALERRRAKEGRRAERATLGGVIDQEPHGDEGGADEPGDDAFADIARLRRSWLPPLQRADPRPLPRWRPVLGRHLRTTTAGARPQGALRRGCRARRQGPSAPLAPSTAGSTYRKCALARLPSGAASQAGHARCAFALAPVLSVRQALVYAEARTFRRSPPKSLVRHRRTPSTCSSAVEVTRRVGGQPVDDPLREEDARIERDVLRRLGRATPAAPPRAAAPPRRTRAAGRAGARAARRRPGSRPARPRRGWRRRRGARHSGCTRARRARPPSSGALGGERDQALVAHDHERRPIEPKRHGLAHLIQLAQHAPAALVEVLGALELEIGVGIDRPSRASSTPRAPRTPPRPTRGDPWRRAHR